MCTMIALIILTLDLLTKTSQQNSQWDEDCNSAEP